MIVPLIRRAAADVSTADLAVIRPAFKAVVLATDGSAPALAATEYAVLLARLLGARLKAVYVYGGFENLALPDEPLSQERFAELEPGVQGLAVARALARSSGVPFTAEVVKGHVAATIVHTADREGAGLIVVGDTGRTGLRRLAIGSVATAVMKTARVPVVIAKPA